MFVKSNVTSPSQGQVNKSPQTGPVARKLAVPGSADKIWASAQEMLRTMLNSDIYNLWFGPVRATALDGDQLTLEVANDFCEVWLKDNYLGLIQDVLMHASGRPIKVDFRVGAGPTPGAASVPNAKKTRTKIGEEHARRIPNDQESIFNPKNTFDTFVV